jgi:hypothetical protein
MGWQVDAAADFLKKAGCDFRITETLAPGRKTGGERRVVRIRLQADGVVELVVVYTGTISGNEVLDGR